MGFFMGKMDETWAFTSMTYSKYVKMVIFIWIFRSYVGLLEGNLPTIWIFGEDFFFRIYGDVLIFYGD